MKTDKTSIYIDLQRLLKALHHASFDIPAKDRIVYLDDAIREAKQVLASFAMAYNFPEGRMYYIRAMVAQFEVLKVSLREMAEEHIFKGKRSDKTGYLLVEMEVFECLGKIEEGLMDEVSIKWWAYCSVDENTKAIKALPGYGHHDRIRRKFKLKYYKHGYKRRNRKA